MKPASSGVLNTAERRLGVHEPGFGHILPFKTWICDSVACFVLTQNEQTPVEARAQRPDPCQQTRAWSPAKRRCGAQSQTASGSGRSRRKRNKWAARGGPGFISGDRPAVASPNALGEARRRTGLPFFNECKASVSVLGGGCWLESRRGISIDV